MIGDYTESLRAAARTVGGQAGPATALTGWADSWLDADASPAARRALLSALSDLHVIAAWCCHDSCAHARARDGYDPPNAHARADMDLVTALVHLHLGALDLAESTAAASVRTFAHGTDRREGILADITLARLHVQAGEPDAPRLAVSAISAVAPLRSGIARAALAPWPLTGDQTTLRPARTRPPGQAPVHFPCLTVLSAV